MGGHFATTYENGGSFKLQVSFFFFYISIVFCFLKTHHIPKKYKKGALIVGRPLFTRELSKVVPPPTSYNINRELG
jgi:hypothetical protein